MKRFTPSEKIRVRRLPKRARYDVETIYSILDAGFICHIGYAIGGQPYVTPTAYWREDDHVYWHGSHASRMLNKAASHKICLTVSHIDGLVVARSGFHHSINYRSVMIFGRPRKVEDEDHKLRAMKTFVERIYPERWRQLRPVTKKELRTTTVLHMAIEEASAKIRTGGPIDDEEDYALPIWAGVVPIHLAHGTPQPDTRLLAGIGSPAHVFDFAHLGIRRA